MNLLAVQKKMWNMKKKPKEKELSNSHLKNLQKELIKIQKAEDYLDEERRKLIKDKEKIRNKIRKDKEILKLKERIISLQKKRKD